MTTFYTQHKKRKTALILALTAVLVSVILITVGIIGGVMGEREASGDTGRLASALMEAKARKSVISAHETAAAKDSNDAVAAAKLAKDMSEKSAATVEKELAEAKSLFERHSTGELGDELIDLLYTSAGRITADTDKIRKIYEDDATVSIEDIQNALDGIVSSGKTLETAADELALDMFSSHLKAAHKAVSNLETRIVNAQNAINKVYKGAGLDARIDVVEKTKEPGAVSISECITFIEELNGRVNELEALANDIETQAGAAQAASLEVKNADVLDVKDVITIYTARNYIGFIFTGVLIIMITSIAYLIPQRFMRAWKRVPVFSTFITAVVMLIIQVYALGFVSTNKELSWGGYWLGNILNVLRGNSSVGMIALGMTFVIITGGIDLAVGSTLAGVATVVMVLLDVSSNGFLTGMGVTGMPNYLIAITAGILTGVLIGRLIGLGVTKGRIPPFIITLGVMNIVRSVAQYFTKSFKTEVPKEFSAIANTEIIGGHMLLPIIYWLALAVIMYIISRHTAFGRHIYAIGSNERSSRLSGINVNKVKMRVYMLMGLIVAIAAITQVARTRGVDVASAGSGSEMNAIAAVVVGGTSMAGGRGSIIGTVLGVLIIGIMDNLLVHLGIDAFLSPAFTGTIIIFAVLMQRKDK